MKKNEKQIVLSKEPLRIEIRCVDNGYSVEVSYEVKPSLSQKAGWVPQHAPVSKHFVEKTKDALLKRLKDVL